ncbi:MAG: adenylate/guanylate cyclase domain-containing protein [Armatimonadetes bacterium]|nr:adenylate/guanylate cyclase domain-containing protein [Armatimonadota bacterium]
MTDVAGFTELMRTNEPQVLSLLRTDIEVIRDHITRNGGEVVKVAGDGILALFASAPKAVRACIDSQVDLENSTLKHRMAIHAGEVTRVEGDAYGDAVNVCSRLEAISTPGSVCASKIVVDLIGAQGLPDPVKQGKVQLKGIENPIEIYTWGTGVRRRRSLRYTKLLTLVAVFLALISLAWVQIPHLGGAKGTNSIVGVLSGNNAANDEELDRLFDQAINDVWEEMDDYEAAKAEAVQKVDAQIAIDWLNSNPMGKRKRGIRELEHWSLVDTAIKKGKSIAGPKATADQIWKALQGVKDPEMDLPKKAFDEEFRSPSQ